MRVLHATEPATVYLSLVARVDGLGVDDVDHAFYDDRSLVKQLAMRRTLFVFPRDLLPAAWGSASARVAAQLRARLAKDVEGAGLAADGAAWLDATCEAVRTRLARRFRPVRAGAARGGPRARRAARDGPRQVLRRQLPDRAAGAEPGSRREAHIVRGRNGGHWRTSRPLWTLMREWLGRSPVPRQARRRVRRPWSPAGWPPSGPAPAPTCSGGSAAPPARPAGARRRSGRSGSPSTGGLTAGCCPTTSTRSTPDAPWAALLPVLDPTVMGWKERGFFLGPHGAGAVRPQRQRRHDRLVGRQGRRLLGPGRGRGGAWWSPAGGRRARGPDRPRRRGRAAHRRGWPDSASGRCTRRPR